MKLALLSIFLALPLLTGCPSSVTAPTPPLASGYSGTPDQQMGATLKGADGYYKTIQCETQGMNWKPSSPTSPAGCVSDPNITSPLVLSATEKTAMNDLMTALNAANLAYTSYHSGLGTEAAAQSAINTASMKQTAAQALIPGVKQ